MVMNKYRQRCLAKLCILFLTIFSPLVFATNVTAIVSKNKVAKNEIFQLRIVVDKKVASDAMDFSQLEKDFYVSRPSFGSSVNIINGNRTTRSEWNLTLAAQSLGIVSIPSFTVDGTSSKPIEISVTADQNEPQISELVEVHNQLGKETLYPNQSTTLKTRLIIKADPRRLQNPKIAAPSVQGLSLEAIGEPNQYQSVLDGVEVTVVDQNYRITADQPGDYVITGIGFKGSLVYSDKKTGATKLMSIDSPAKTYPIKVAKIPESCKGKWLPAASLKLSQQWTDASGNSLKPNQTFSIKVGDSITRIINLDIDGLASERFPDLAVSYPESIRVYQEKPKFTELENGHTRMTIKQVLIPKTPGGIVLDPISIGWWNSERNEAENTVIAGLTLNVSAAAAINAEPTSVPLIQPTPSETITIKDPSFWPYLTALFATLWLITLFFWYRAKHTVIKEKQEPSAELSIEKDFQTTYENQGSIQAQFTVSQWLQNHNQIDLKLQQQIREELQLMNESQYSSTDKPWKKDTLIKLLKKAQKASRKTDTNPSLAEL